MFSDVWNDSMIQKAAVVWNICSRSECLECPIVSFYVRLQPLCAAFRGDMFVPRTWTQLSRQSCSNCLEHSCSSFALAIHQSRTIQSLVENPSLQSSLWEHFVLRVDLLTYLLTFNSIVNKFLSLAVLADSFQCSTFEIRYMITLKLWLLRRIQRYSVATWHNALIRRHELNSE